MRLPLLINLSLLLLLSWQAADAQLAPPDDFFHSGAQFYISNNIPAAKERVEMGLKMYPDDEKLKKLEELLKQQQQSQSSQSQQNQNQQQQNQSSSQKNSQNQRKPDEQKQNADQKKPEPPKQAEQQNGGKPDDQKGEGQPVTPGQMTPEEAKRLLDAQKDNEQLLALKPQGKPEDNNRPVKDW